MSNKFSYQMHDQTERVGQQLPRDTHHIISHRYQFAATLCEEKRVLEVGAGHGIALRLISQLSKSFVAGEFSDENIQLMQQRDCQNSQLTQFDAHHLPFKENSFDVILTLAMIYYLDFSAFLKQASTVLAHGGTLFFCTSNKSVPGFVPAPYTTKYYTPPELDKMLSEAGFECEFYGAFPAAGNTHRYRLLKAVIKNFFKAFVHILPMGKQLWLRLRSKKMGETLALPLHVEDIQSENIEAYKISPATVNREFRIIYGVATLQKDKL